MGTLHTIDNIPAYEVEAIGETKGGIIVIHEVWGLTDHIKDMAERFAREGYHVVAPNLIYETDIAEHGTKDMQHDLFHPDLERRNAVQPKLRELMAPIRTPEFGAKTLERVKACFDYLYKLPVTNKKVAIVGYCFGGSYSFQLAVHEPRLLASVPYYGHADLSVEELRQITCPILAFYGEQDERLMASLPQLKQNMHDAEVDFTAEVYVSAGHAFNNDSNHFAYNKDAAADAWSKTLVFLERAASSKV